MIDLYEYLNLLHSSQDTQSAFNIYEKYVTQLEFDGVLYAFFPLLIGSPKVKKINPAFYASKGYNQDFLRTYIERSFYKHDYALAQMAKGVKTPIFWWDSAKFMNQKELEVIQVAKQFGLSDGVVLPMDTKGEGIAGASIVSHEKNQATFELLKKERLQELVVITNLFHKHVSCQQKLYSPFLFPLIERLSNKEQVVLRQLLTNIDNNKGTTMKFIAKDVQSESKSCEHALKRVKDKLGIISTNQLIYSAGVLQLLDVFQEWDKQKK